VWETSLITYTPFARYNRLSNRLYNRFENQLYGVNRHPTGFCQTGCQAGFTNRLDVCLHDTAAVKLVVTLTTGLTTMLNEQPMFVQPVVKPGCTTGLTTGCTQDTAGCQTGCQTGLTTGWMFVYTIQPGWQPVVSCIQTFTRLSSQFDNRFDNRLYSVNGALLHDSGTSQRSPRLLFWNAGFNLQEMNDPSYSSDLAPSDSVFRRFKKECVDVSFRVTQSAGHDPDFYVAGISSLPAQRN